MLTVVDQLPRLGKREVICLLLFTGNCVVSVWRGFLFLWVLGMGCVILLWHSPSLRLVGCRDPAYSGSTAYADLGNIMFLQFIITVQFVTTVFWLAWLKCLKPRLKFQ